MERVKVAPDSRGFVLAESGRPFVPWGFNYDRDYKLRLIEDYWIDEWGTVEEDFREMKQLGANVVRVHLSLGKFLDGPNKPNKASLRQLKKLVKLAERTGLYLDVTGLGCYRKRDVPAWYDAMNEADRWATQARFWREIARRCKDSPAVFFYDLMNEPIVPEGKREPGDWMIGELGGFHYVQFITLDQAGRKRDEIARRWVATLVAAIREEDANHLISVGLLPNSLDRAKGTSGFLPKSIAAEVDFLCVHFYPDSSRKEQDLADLKQFDVGKPLVIEEIFALGCTFPELAEFIEQSKAHADGWLGFYWGKPPEELRKSDDKVDGALLQWLELFQRMNPNSPQRILSVKPRASV